MIISVYALKMTKPDKTKISSTANFERFFLRFPAKISLSLQVTLTLDLSVQKINGKAFLGHMGRKVQL